MNTARKTFDRNYNDLLGFVIGSLPDGWRLELVLVEEEASLCLYDPDEKHIEWSPDDGDAVDHWVYYVNYAREAEGLTLVTWDNYWSAKGGA